MNNVYSLTISDPSFESNLKILMKKINTKKEAIVSIVADSGKYIIITESTPNIKPILHD